ncbi:MAG: RNA polymerase sigma factor [Actinomycetales bacterium]
MTETYETSAELTWLVIAAGDGDQVAWNTIVERFGKLVYGVSRGFRLAPSDAADVTQVVWLRLAENISRLEHPERLGGWLITTTRRECMAVLRTRSKFEPLEVDYDAMPSTAPGPAEQAIRRETIAEVATAFTLISQRCQELLRRLVANPGESYQELTRHLGMPIGSIGPTRMRCLSKLRAALEKTQAVGAR